MIPSITGNSTTQENAFMTVYIHMILDEWFKFQEKQQSDYKSCNKIEFISQGKSIYMCILSIA